MVELIIVGIGILVFLLFIAVCIAMAALSLAMAASAVIWSRAAFGLLFAYGLSNSYGIVSEKLPNFLIWAVIVLGIIFLLSMLPRVDYALKFFCTMCMCYLASEIVGGVSMGVICGLAGKDFEITMAYELVIKSICLIVSLGSTVIEMQRGPKKMGIHSPNVVVDILQKILSSVTYGVAIVFLFAISSNSALVLPEATNWLIFIGTTVLAFLAEMFLIDRLVGQT